MAWLPPSALRRALTLYRPEPQQECPQCSTVRPWPAFLGKRRALCRRQFLPYLAPPPKYLEPTFHLMRRESPPALFWLGSP